MEEPNLYQPPKAETDMQMLQGQGPGTQVANAFYAVSPAKLILLDLTTLNLYSVYWMYKQWQTIRDSSEYPKNISPFWRAFFSVFFVHELFRTIRMSSSSVDVPTASGSSGQATFWLIITIASNLVSRADGVIGLLGIFIGFLAVIPLANVQREINAYLRKVNPAADLNERFSALNIIVIILGTILLALAVLGSLQPAAPR